MRSFAAGILRCFWHACMQKMYDFGLRALKALLMLAGKLRRGQPEEPETLLLLHALRSVNIPKLLPEVHVHSDTACLLLVFVHDL